jgi:CrcB protein
MKGIIEFVLIAIGAVAGTFLGYKITSSSMLLLDTLLVNVLLVNVIGSFILGIFSVLAVTWNLDSKLDYEHLSSFLGKLRKREYLFSEELLLGAEM